MKKIKSIFAFLLLGSLTLSGCAFLDFFKGKKSEDTPSEQQGSGEEGQGEGEGGGGTVVTDRFTNKKLVYDSIVFPEGTTDEQKQGTIAYFEDQYLSFFSDGSFEDVMPDDEYPMLYSGTYTLSEDKQSATVTVTGMKSHSGAVTFPEDDQDTVPIAYNADTGKYSLRTGNSEFEIEVIVKDSGVAPEHYEIQVVEEESYKITVNLNYGDNVKVEIGETDGSFKAPQFDPRWEREGYDFAGWALVAEPGANDHIYQPGDDITVTADVMLYAQWTPAQATQECVVEFNLQGHGDEIPSQTVSEGEHATRPDDPQAEGWVFGGWYEEAGCEHEFDFAKPISANTPIFAKWTEDTSGQGETFAPHVHYSDGTEWKDAKLVANPVEGHPEQVAVEHLELKAEAEFVIQIEDSEDGYLHYSNYHPTLETHGQITHCTDTTHEGHEDHADNLIAVSDGYYSVYVRKDSEEHYEVFVAFTPKEGDTKVYPPCVHYSHGGEWLDAPLVADPVEGHPEQYKIAGLTLSADDEFAINMGTAWLHSDVFTATEDTHGAAAAHGENIAVSQDGEYSIFVNTAGIFVSFDSYTPPVTPTEPTSMTFHIPEAWLCDSHIFIHYWGEGKEPKDVELTQAVSEVEFEAGYTGYLIVRTTAESYAEVVEEGTEDNCWGKSADLTIAESELTVAYGEGDENIVVSAYVEPVTPPEPVDPGDPTESTTVYIETKGWFNSGDSNEHVYVYAFKKDSNPIVQNAAFPGEEASWICDLNEGKKIFSFEIGAEYDTFIVVRVVGTAAGYQTVDISLSALGENNCVYLNADAGSGSIPVGYYTYTPAAQA